MDMKKRAIIFGLVIILGVLGFISIRGFLERTIVSLRTEEYSETEEGKEELEYIKVRLRGEILASYTFREKTGKENLLEIKEIREKLEKIKTEKLRGGYLEDYKIFKEELGELEKVLGEDLEAGDKQLKFIEKSVEYGEKGKVTFYTSRVAFEKDERELEKTGIFLANGAEILTTEGEGRINILLGGEEGVGITLEDLEKNEGLKREGEVFLINKKTGGKVKISESLKGEFKKGRLRAVKVKFPTEGGAIEVKTTEISLRGKATWDLKNELEAREITGLTGEAYIKNSIPETLVDSLRRLEEIKTGEGE